jgi:uridine kinase
MTKIVLIRGPPAVGKTTVTKEILKKLKSEKIDCAYICEDDFRKQMQYKYKSDDLIAHLNSVELIKNLILKLLELDSYEFIFIEGLFRYKDVLEKYILFCETEKLQLIMLQLDLDLNELKHRDDILRRNKSKDLEKVKKDIDKFTPENITFLDGSKNINELSDEIIDYIMR